MRTQTRGALACAADSVVWGSTIVYWPYLAPASDSEILGQRLVWAALIMAGVIVAAGRVRSLLEVLGNARSRVFLLGASAAITANWAGFVWASLHGHVAEASLGFFIGPLMNVVLGVGVLRERASPGQWAAVALASAAVLLLSISYGHIPWLALALGLTGGLYGLCKKQAAAGALESLAVETGVVAPFAIVFVLWQASRGESTFTSVGWEHTALLIGGGIVTVVPLLFFGYAVVRVPLVLLGLISYLGPVTTFVLALTYFNEPMSALQWIGFSLIWGALVVVAVDGLRSAGLMGGTGGSGGNRRPEDRDEDLGHGEHEQVDGLGVVGILNDLRHDNRQAERLPRRPEARVNVPETDAPENA